MRSTFVASVLALASVALAQDQTVMVGQGGLMFTPQFINATKGSVITFMFAAANHSVAESSFATPCEPIAGGFNSGFVPFTDEPGVWNLTVTDDATPIWFYCPQQAKAPAHCTAGMVGAINGAVTGKDLNAFVAAAKAATTIIEPSTVLSGVGAFATLAPTTIASSPAGASDTQTSSATDSSPAGSAPTDTGAASDTGAGSAPSAPSAPSQTAGSGSPTDASTTTPAANPSNTNAAGITRVNGVYALLAAALGVAIL